MLNKSKYSEIDVQFEPLKANEKINMSLEYYLVEDMYKDEDQNQNFKTYGIEIIKKEFLPDSAVNVEKKSAKHLSVNKQKVKDLLETLSNNTVTPVNLNSILDNLLGVSC